VVFLTVIGSLGGLSLFFKGTSNYFSSYFLLNQKADLLLKTANDYAVFILKNHNYEKGVVKKIKFEYDGFEINVILKTFLNELNKDGIFVKTGESNLSVFVFTEVKCLNSHFHLRKTSLTLQKP